MTNDQEKHLAAIQREFSDRVGVKYRKGQEEHGGNLWLKPAMPLLLEEVLDQVTYALTLRDQLQGCARILLEAHAEGDWHRVLRVALFLEEQAGAPSEKMTMPTEEQS